MYRLKSIIYLFILLMMVSCDKEKIAPPRPFFYKYYPLTNGKVWIYDVDSTAYDDFTGGAATNFKFKIKDSVADNFEDLTGNIIYRVERYKKQNGGNKWIYQKTITRSLSIRAAQETIDNQTFIRLIFPPELGAEWNGNSKNTLGEYIYRITDFPVVTSIGNLDYDSTLVVLQSDENNLIREDIASEVYAKNIGLIKKEVRAIEKKFSSGIITKGFIYSMALQAP